MNKLIYLLLVYVLACNSKSDNAVDPEPYLNKQDLFKAGEADYLTFRIPGIVVTSKGTILAYCVGRKGQGGDWDDIDIVLRRSEDGGNSWADMQVIADMGTFPTDNPMAFVDYETGDIHMLFQSNYNLLYYMKSEDDGVSFSEPKDITTSVEKFKEIYPWVVMAPGPGHGIQLRNGRLVVPFWLSDGTAKEFGPEYRGHRPSIVVSVYSDDHGQTWQPGETVCENTESTPVPSETSLVELADGSVMFNMRNESPVYRRLISTSKDGATGWSEPYYADAFFEPICFGSMTRFTLEGPQSKNRILFVNPDSRHVPGKFGPGYLPYAARGRSRENLTVRMSYDEGDNWPVKKVLDPLKSGYSDLSVLPDGTILCLYENGGNQGTFAKTAAVTLARFNVEWLTDGKDHLSVTDKPIQQTYLK